MSAEDCWLDGVVRKECVQLSIGSEDEARGSSDRKKANNGNGARPRRVPTEFLILNILSTDRYLGDSACAFQA